jgi:peptidyl-prolyl cis-trans isomerase A (cyclophilin A)
MESVMSKTVRLLGVVIVIAAFGASVAQSTEREEPIFVPSPDLPEGWYARIETSLGRIVAMLHPDQAPQSVAYFAGLASGTFEWLDPVSGQLRKEPYYDGTEIHFAKAGHLFETGQRYGPQGGTPELYVPVEGRSPRGFDRPGRLGMSTSGAGNGAVVFFITASPNRGLAGKHPCFGTVVSDIDVVYAITEVKTRSSGRPIDPVTIDRIRIFKVGDPAPLDEPVPFKPQRVPLERDRQNG